MCCGMSFGTHSHACRYIERRFDISKHIASCNIAILDHINCFIVNKYIGMLLLFLCSRDNRGCYAPACSSMSEAMHQSM